MENKNKKIKTIALAGGLSFVCLSTVLAMNINEKNKMSNYSNIVKLANQDLSDKDLTQSYYKLFEESKLYNTLIKEFNTIRIFSTEETKTDITFNIVVDSDKALENEKELYKKELNDLFDKLNTINSNKNIIFNIDVKYEIDKDLKDSTIQCTSDAYSICKNKLDNTSFAISKTKYYNIDEDWKTRYYIYNINDESFETQNLEEGSEDSVYIKAINSFYPESDYNTSSYNSKKITYFENDSVRSLFNLSLDKNYRKANPKELIDTLIAEVSSDDNIDYVSINIDGRETGDSKYYNATLDETGKVVEYDLD